MFLRSLALLVTAFLFTAQAVENFPAAVFRNLESGKKQTVIVYGTSLTAGGAWAGAMKKWFNDQYPGLVNFINSGGPGQNSDWGKANVKARVADHRPDLVLIEFSYNDAHEKFKMPVERGAENLDAIIKAIRASNPDVAIVLQIMNAPWDAPGDKRPAANRPKLEAYNDNYRRYAKEQELPLLDHYPAYKRLLDAEPEKYYRWLPDGSHPRRKQAWRSRGHRFASFSKNARRLPKPGRESAEAFKPRGRGRIGLIPDGAYGLLGLAVSDNRSSTRNALMTNLTQRTEETQSREDADALPVGMEHHAPEAPPPVLGRVLLLEDDPAFQEVIRDFLAENGYVVVPVKNGGEGVAQILEGEFALVLCDLNMPGLPGDMFYRAVERIRPDLCARFVFMTGYRGDAKLNEYIKSIGCWVLRKPFPLEDLLALFAFTAERGMLQTICDWEPPTAKAPQKPAAPEPPAPHGGKLPVPPLPDPHLKPHIPLAVGASPISWLGEATGESSPKRKRSSWLDISVVLAVILGFQYLDENNAATAGLAELQSLQKQWSELEPDLERATAAREEFEQSSAAVERNRRADEAQWTSALKNIALAINPAIEITGFEARQVPNEAGAYEARISGVARGEQGRKVADRFRQVIEDSLSSDVANQVVKVKFERLEDAQDDAGASNGANFTIVIAGRQGAPVTLAKRGRTD